MTPFAPGQLVVVNHPTMGREYGTIEGGPTRHSDDFPEVYSVTLPNRYTKLQAIPASMMVAANGQRDMHPGDLLNIDMLKEALEIEFLGSLWTEGDSGMLTPYVCDVTFGDGLKLLTIATCNQRPNYHIVRVDSGWSLSNWGAGECIGDHIDEITEAIEEECGARYWVDEDCAECDREPCRCDGGAPWPAIDDENGCGWGEISWKEIMQEIGLMPKPQRTAA